MYTKHKAIQEVISGIKQVLGKGYEVAADTIETPKNADHGDLAFPCFHVAKESGKNPVEIAKEIVGAFKGSHFIKSAEALGPYVNFRYDTEVFAKSVMDDVDQEGGAYGHSSLGKSKRVMVEYGQPNTHKELHIGHVRNILLGQAVVNTLHANGFDVIAASYINDKGADVAKSIWGYTKFQNEEKIPKEDRARRLGELYVEANAYIAEHEEAKEDVDRVYRGLENHEEPWQSIWKETRKWSIEEFKRVFTELGMKPDVYYFESDVEDRAKEVVQKLLTDKIAIKSEGATIIDLEDEDLGAMLVLKSDGTSLYATADLALAEKKQDDYAPDRQIFVVDNRQSLYFKQLFATLKRMGMHTQFTHIAYDFVTLPDGAMSSRKGNVMLYREVIEELRNELVRETNKRHEDWKDTKVRETAHAIAHAALGFMMLRQDSNSIITFDKKEALSFDGFTGPYILYTLARITSLHKKTKIKPVLDAKKLKHSLERALLAKISDYPSVVEHAGASFQISAIATWVFEAAKLFAEYYAQARIVDEKNKEMTASRLALAGALSQSMNNALGLLGIRAVEEM